MAATTDQPQQFYQYDPALPTAEDFASFSDVDPLAAPVPAQQAPPIPPKQSTGITFNFDAFRAKAEQVGYAGLSAPEQRLIDQMASGIIGSPETMAQFLIDEENRLRQQNSPQAQAELQKSQLDLQKSQLDLQKSQSEVGQIESRKQAAAAEIAGMRQMLAELKGHPGMSASVGAKGAEYLFGIKKEPIGGTKAADFYTLLEQVQGGTFMQAFNNLKGAGQITEQEGAKATAAIARLNPRQSEEGFNKALMDFDGVLAQAQARSQANAPQQAPQAAPQAAPQPMPQAPAAPATRVIGGRTFIQQPNGNWIPR